MSKSNERPPDHPDDDDFDSDLEWLGALADEILSTRHTNPAGLVTLARGIDRIKFVDNTDASIARSIADEGVA